MENSYAGILEENQSIITQMEGSGAEWNLCYDAFAAAQKYTSLSIQTQKNMVE